jgi:hypothetical protein
LKTPQQRLEIRKQKKKAKRRLESDDPKVSRTAILRQPETQFFSKAHFKLAVLKKYVRVELDWQTCLKMRSKVVFKKLHPLRATP